MAVGRWLAAALIALPVTQAFAPLVGAPLGAWRYPSSLQWGNGRERAWAAGSQGSRLGDCSALTMILSRTREHAAAAAIGTLLLTFSLACGGDSSIAWGDSSLKDGGQQKMETHRHAVLLAEANDEDYEELLPGTELIPPTPNSFLLCRGPGDSLAGGNKCIEIAYPLLALPVLNGAVFLGLLALKKFQDEQEEPPPPGNKK